MVQELKLHVSTAGGVSLIPGHGNNIPHATSLVDQMVKHLSTMQETWVRSQGQEDPLEMGIATNSSIFLQYFCLENSMDRGAW